jgi:chromosome partitioning protein
MFSAFQADVDAILGRQKTFDWIRVLITLGEKNNTSVEMEEIIRKAYGELVLTQKFPYLTAVATASKRMRTIYDVNRADIPSRQLVAAQMLVDQMCGAIEDLVVRTRAQRAGQQAAIGEIA